MFSNAVRRVGVVIVGIAAAATVGWGFTGVAQAEPLQETGTLCTWAGTTYSPGGVVVESDGTKHTCKADGTWSFAGRSIVTGGLGVNRVFSPMVVARR